MAFDAPSTAMPAVVVTMLPVPIDVDCSREGSPASVASAAPYRSANCSVVRSISYNKADT